jgi:hypothetical protein
MKFLLRALAMVSLFMSLASVASAQDRPVPEDPGESARFQWGALRFTPSIALSSLGVDSNVFNTTDDPRRDTTAALGPAVNLWLKVGPARLSGKTSGQYLYFKTYDSQRAWNTNDNLRIDLPLARLKPFLIGNYVNTRDRPGFEIDSRARSATNTVTLGTDLRLSGKTTFVLSGSRTTTAFDQHETFLGAALAQALNRRSDIERLQFRYALTPLTTLVVNNDAIQDRFDFEPARDADSFRVLPGFEFKPSALISGAVAVGFRHFNARDETFPDFNGVVASVDARYTLAATQFQAQIHRDLAFSFEAANPYYALTDVNVAVTERITQAWDIIGRAGTQKLDYRQIQTSVVSTRPADKGRLYGLGIGYRLGETARLGLDVNYVVRRSPETLRQYEGFRVGATVSYGLSQ